MNKDILIGNLTGETSTFNTAIYDCYVLDKFGVFIPIYQDNEIQTGKHNHPSYEIIIDFSRGTDKRHYKATITSPGVEHTPNQAMHSYSVFIDKEYFESRFKMYQADIPVFAGKSFEFCSDILKALNTFQAQGFALY